MADKAVNEAVKKMAALGEKRGFVTYNELDSVLPSDAASRIVEDVLNQLSEMGMNVIDSEVREP